MGTDITDQNLKKLRNDRWDTAFSTQDKVMAPNRNMITMKAPIVIEHLIQASGVAQTMQYWHGQTLD
jgi:hypothetical protein